MGKHVKRHVAMDAVDIHTGTQSVASSLPGLFLGGFRRLDTTLKKPILPGGSNTFCVFSLKKIREMI